MKRSRARRTMTMKAELIPGLPDCLALECLLRLPFHAILDARAVCKRWKHELDSPSFYRIRRTAGLAHRIVSLLLQGKLPHTVGNLHLALYEPDTGVCTMRQLAPNRPNSHAALAGRGLAMGRDAAVVGRELVVFGGWDVLENRRSGEVHIYDLHTGAWRPGTPNPAPERLFCWFVLNRQKVLVIGGRDAEGKKLQSALVYNVAADTWIEMLDFEEQKCQDDDSFCDEFWQSKEEYNSAILCCRKWLLVEDEDDVRICPTGKEIYMSVPEEKKSDSEDKSKEKVMVTKSILNRNVLRNLRQRLGLRPNEVALYLESYYSGRL
ncbi:hypothetical protein ZIOFF_041364 [Zingiber officinale]|uniref:F-box domain-containing protein n=1 Tax=Zingiber officinale TaxID=94328 RepID=A0A8J5G6W1_ZINOF|nr:hypothetical protein ZIOFF_041364 [Zingiber officinale]